MFLADEIIVRRPHMLNPAGFNGCPRFAITEEVLDIAQDYINSSGLNFITAKNWAEFPYEKFWIEFHHKNGSRAGAILTGTVESFHTCLVHEEDLRSREWLSQVTYVLNPERTEYEINAYKNPHMTVELTQRWLQKLIFMLAFMNCRNLLTTEIVRPFKRVRNILEHKKLPIISYSVLKLRESSVVSKVRSESGSIGVRAHLVRGHFKRRKTGIYWWAPFARGNAKLGIKNKDYALVK